MDEEDFPSERVIHQPPSCIEFCPTNSSIFVVGTYKLEDRQADSTNSGEKKSQSRSGRVEVYQIRKRTPSSCYGLSQCIDKYDFPDSAVLDLHFDLQEPVVFAVCTSTSQIVFFRLENVERGSAQKSIEPSLLKVGSLQIGQDDSVLATSFAWDPYPINSNYMSIAVTFSSGETKLFEIRRDMKSKAGHNDFFILTQASIDPAHTLEAWMVAFAELSCLEGNEKMLLTAGDDSTLAGHKIKIEPYSPFSSSLQLFQDRKSHTAGVTAILPILDAGQPYVIPRTRAFITGCYDEHIRVFTIEERPPHKRQMEAEISLGGGVWRLRKLSESLGEEVAGDHVCSVLILASCMHAGVRIIRIIRRQPIDERHSWCSWQIEVVGEFTDGHESMCYGADSVELQTLVGDAENMDLPSQRQRSGNSSVDDDPGRDFVVVSTSFYDKKICVWSFHNRETGVERVKADLQAYQEIVRRKDADREKAKEEREDKRRQEEEFESVTVDSDTESWTLLPDQHDSHGSDAIEWPGSEALEGGE
jgi:diphthine methyl ester acylhydrolase